MNALTDEAMIDELYDASQQGAQIDIVARSICSLRPGVEGLSENIRVRASLGRFLEHSRFFIFERRRRACVLHGSADLMPRNLDNRLEVVAPVEDRGSLQERCSARSSTSSSPTTSRRELGNEGLGAASPQKDEAPLGTHAVLMKSARPRARRRAAALRRGQ